MKIYFIVLCAIVLSGCSSTSDLEVVKNFDAERYMGTWYEVIRYPHRFEKGMSSVSATYTLNADGTIKVVNRGYMDHEKSWESIEGVAKLKGNASDGWLKVSFFKPFYASYKIIYLDDNYTQAIVTGPSYGYLWILVRDPDLEQSELERLIEKAEAKGFDKNRMLKIEQSKNVS